MGMTPNVDAGFRNSESLQYLVREGVRDARLAAGVIGGAAGGTALVQQLELKYARTLYVPAAILLALGAAGRLKLFAGPPQNAGLTNAKDIVPNSARQELVPPHNP